MLKYQMWICAYIIVLGTYAVPLFSQQYIPTRLDGDLRGGIFIADSIVLTYGTNGIVLRSTDIGESWMQVAGLKEKSYFCGTAIGTTVALFGENNSVLISQDLGITWIELTALGSQFTQSSQCTAVSIEQFLFTDNLGRLYLYNVKTNINTLVKGLKNIEINLIVSVGERSIMAAGPDGIYQSVDNGVTWVKFQDIVIPASFVRPVNSSLTKSGKVCFFYSNNSNELIIISTTDSGKYWQITKNFEATHATMISETDCITFNQVNNNSVRIDSVFTSIITTNMIIDNKYIQVKPYIYGLLNMNDRSVIMYGRDKSLYKAEKDSHFFSLVSLFNHERVYYSTITTDKRNTLFLAGDQMAFYTSHNQGATWKPRLNRLGTRFSIGCNSARIFDSTLFVTTSRDKVLFRTTDGGNHFDTFGLKDSNSVITEFYNAVDIVSPNLILKTTRQTQLLLILDTGRTWELRANPIKAIEYIGNDSLVITRNFTQLKYLKDSIIIARLWENKYNKKNGQQTNTHYLLRSRNFFNTSDTLLIDTTTQGAYFNFDTSETGRYYIQGNSKNRAQILLTTNSGRSWSLEMEDSVGRYEHLPKQEIPQQFTMRSTFGGAVQYTNDSGATWQYVTLPQDSLRLSLISPYSKNRFYCSGLKNNLTSLYRFDVKNTLNTEVEVSTDQSQGRVWIHEVRPNPFKNIISAKVGRSDAANLNDVVVAVYNIFGEQVYDLTQEYRGKTMNEFNEVELTWNSAEYPQGIYLLRINSSSYSYSVKIAKVY